MLAEKLSEFIAMRLKGVEEMALRWARAEGVLNAYEQPRITIMEAVKVTPQQEPRDFRRNHRGMK